MAPRHRRGDPGGIKRRAGELSSGESGTRSAEHCLILLCPETDSPVRMACNGRIESCESATRLPLHCRRT
jgi:hypothetical protein